VAFGAGCGKVIENPDFQQARPKRARLVNQAGQLSFLCRPESISLEVLRQFEEEYATRVTLERYETSAEGMQKLAAGKGDLLLIAGLDYQAMIHEKKLATLSHGTVTNGAHVERFYERLAYDYHKELGVPYFWRMIGIGYNVAEEAELPRHWAELFDHDKWPEAERDHQNGKACLFNEGRYVLGSALIHLGFSPNTTNRAEIQQAAAVLKKLRPYVAGFDDYAGRRFMVGEEAFIGLAWGSDIAVARTRNPKLRFVIPDEGALIFSDYLAVPKASAKQSTAELLLNFLLRPEIAAANAMHASCASAQMRARAHISRELLNGPAYLLPDMASEFFSLRMVDPSTRAFHDQLWQEIKRGAP
jgi:spermidine/putrescine transport system substrate-binding protein